MKEGCGFPYGQSEELSSLGSTIVLGFAFPRFQKAQNGPMLRAVCVIGPVRFFTTIGGLIAV